MSKKGPSLDEVMGALLSGRAKVRAVEMPDVDDDDDDVISSARAAGEYKIRIGRDVQAMELSLAAMRYKKSALDYKVGDFVTPLPCHAIKGAGNPHVVLEVRDAEPNFKDDHEGSAANGRRLDMRVACYVSNDTIHAFWVESWQYEAWKA